jgi:beta-xylosidase
LYYFVVAHIGVDFISGVLLLISDNLIAFMKNSRIVLLCFLAISCKEDAENDDLVGTIQFVKHETPVWQGQWTAADPSVIRDGDTLRLYYSSYILDTNEKLVIAGAKSVDGINWVPAKNNSGESIALDANPGQWDNHLEAISVIQDGDGLSMYYCGYEVEADVGGTIVAKGQIGLARSADKINFVRNATTPILSLGDANRRDANALFSPTVIKEGDTYYMLYVGYCIENCSPAFIGILGATSTDGIHWQKRQEPVIAGVDFDLPWANVIKEPAIVKGPDNMYYLFISGDETIGVARSKDIFGPYEVFPQPVMKKEYSWESTASIAPAVLIENGKARMWYMGVDASDTGADFVIGYGEADFPFNW